MAEGQDQNGVFVAVDANPPPDVASAVLVLDPVVDPMAEPAMIISPIEAAPIAVEPPVAIVEMNDHYVQPIDPEPVQHFEAVPVAVAAAEAIPQPEVMNYGTGGAPPLGGAIILDDIPAIEGPRKSVALANGKGKLANGNANGHANGKPGKEWECKVCTLKNPAKEVRCAVCMEFISPEAEAAWRKALPDKVKRMHTVRRNVWDEEEAEPQRKPYFMITILIANLAMFVYEMAESDWKFESPSTNPMLGPSTKAMIACGAKVTKYIRQGELQRMIAPMFLHAGLVHLLMNMSVLYRLGFDLERAYGPWRAGLVYFISGEFGLLMSAIFLPELLGVGASGALYGLIGSMFADFYLNYHNMEQGRGCYFFSLVANSLVGLALGLMPMLDNFAHVGGWLAGIVAGFACFSGSKSVARDRDGNKRKIFMVKYGGILTLILMFLVAVPVLFAGVNAFDWCSWCTYISCVDTPWWDCSAQIPMTCLQNRTTGAYYNCTPLNQF